MNQIMLLISSLNVISSVLYYCSNNSLENTQSEYLVEALNIQFQY